MADPKEPAGQFSRFEPSEQVAHSGTDEPHAVDLGAGEESFSVRASRTYEPIDRPASKPFPLAWALLALPVFLLTGWLVGQMPARPRPAPEVTEPGAMPVVVEPQSGTSASTAEPEAARPQRLSSWTTLARAEEESQRTGKPILLDFNAEWCGPCRRMKSEVFDHHDLGDAVRRAVIPVSVVDRSREDGRNSEEVERLLQNWSIEAFPTLIVYHPGTGRSMQTRGFGGAQHTVQWIEQSASAVR